MEDSRLNITQHNTKCITQPKKVLDYKYIILVKSIAQHNT